MSDIEITVSPAWVQNIVNFIKSYGFDRDMVWKESGVDGKKVKLGQRLSMDDTVRIWQSCVDICKDPWFGLRLGKNISPSVFHIVGYTLMNSENLSSALRKLSRYQRLVSDGGGFQQLPSDEGIWLIYHSHPQTLPFLYHQIDAVLTALLTFSQWVCNAPVMPEKVNLRRNRPGDISEYKNVFGVEPSFSEKFDGLLVSREIFEKPLPGADPDLCQLHELYARRRLEELSHTETLVEKVERLIEQELSNPMMNRAFIAKQLLWSEKKLQRYLAKEGISFQKIQDNTRKRLATSYVTDTFLPLSEITTILGFSDDSAFNRAFKRWHGCSPGVFRSSH